MMPTRKERDEKERRESLKEKGGSESVKEKVLSKLGGDWSYTASFLPPNTQRVHSSTLSGPQSKVRRIIHHTL